MAPQLQENPESRWNLANFVAGDSGKWSELEEQFKGLQPFWLMGHIQTTQASNLETHGAQGKQHGVISWRIHSVWTKLNEKLGGDEDIEPTGGCYDQCHRTIKGVGDVYYVRVSLSLMGQLWHCMYTLIQGLNLISPGIVPAKICVKKEDHLNLIRCRQECQFASRKSAVV